MKRREPDFENNLLKVFKKEKPDRATLFEEWISSRLLSVLAGHAQEEGKLGRLRLTVDAMANAGYDHAPCGLPFTFREVGRTRSATVSLNGEALITDWESFEKFEWPDADHIDTSSLENIKPYLPIGMKLVAKGPGGVLENVIDLVGYDNLCIMMFEEPELVGEIFNAVGSRLLKYYEACVGADVVGALCSNDDWGFNTQTFLSPSDMRKYVFPWHKRIVELAHKNGKPCMLHSCGYYGEVIEDVINGIGFDARHSYEDNITPVEQAYEELNGRIAVLGGIDINFLTTKTPEEVYTRSRAMLERSADRGGYALGSGNSIPDYIPYENYMAMLRAATEFVY